MGSLQTTLKKNFCNKMPILKFFIKDNKVLLEKGDLVEITHDKRTSMLPKDAFIKNEFKVADGIYIAENSFIMDKAIKEKPTVGALYCYHNECHIIIVAPRSYVFFNGKSVDIAKFSLLSFAIPSDLVLGW
jgi:hypothetical protein